jgi:hypothetical protein
MIQVSIPVHPLTLRVLRAEYGPGPIVMSNHDPLFTFITCSPLRHRQTKSSDVLSTEVTFQVDDRLAMHLQQYDWQVGSALLKLHKMELCKFAASAVMLGHKGGAKAGLYAWLMRMEITEDEYSLETAYKLWQRFGWKFYSAKSSTFLAQMRGKTADLLGQKRGRMPKPNRHICRRTFTLSEIEIELAAHRFSKQVEQCFSRSPKKLEGQARIYYYVTYTKLTHKEVGDRLGIPRRSISNAAKSIRMKAEKNITLHRMLAAALPDVATPPTPSGHGTSITRNRAQVHPDSRVAQAAGLN